MPHLNRQNIDRKTYKPNDPLTESRLGPDLLLNRASQTRRDDDIIRTPKRTVYDIDYAIKSYIEQEIQPSVNDNGTVIPVPVIFAYGEKWDNVRRLGYMRDEKGMLQSPAIMIKRTSFNERDNYKTLDVNRPHDSNYLIYRNYYNANNRYEDTLFPFPIGELTNESSVPVYIIDIPKYITVEYELMLWTDFSTQLNDLVNDIFIYNRFAWGNGPNSYNSTLGTVSFETINTVNDDRIVRATIPLSVHGTIQNGNEVRMETIKKMFSIKKVSFDMVIDVPNNIFESTAVPTRLLQQQSSIMSGGKVVVSSPSAVATIDSTAMNYLTQLSEKQATYLTTTTIEIAGTPKINPVTNAVATINEFDLYINGQYIDKQAYNWFPNDTLSVQTITFDTAALGYTISSDDLIIINGRWT